MVKITGGVPGGWHGGQLPGASSPFLFRFDKDGCANVEDEIARYLTSVPGPFAMESDSDDSIQAELTDAESDDDKSSESNETPKRTTRRKKSLDE